MNEFYVLLTMHPCTILQINLTRSTIQCDILFISLSACFGCPCAHHQEKITVSMPHWHLSLCMDGIWSAGWISIQPADHDQGSYKNEYMWKDLYPVQFVLR